MQQHHLPGPHRLGRSGPLHWSAPPHRCLHPTSRISGLQAVCSRPSACWPPVTASLPSSQLRLRPLRPLLRWPWPEGCRVLLATVTLVGCRYLAAAGAACQIGPTLRHPPPLVQAEPIPRHLWMAVGRMTQAPSRSLMLWTRGPHPRSRSRHLFQASQTPRRVPGHHNAPLWVYPPHSMQPLPYLP